MLYFFTTRGAKGVNIENKNDLILAGLEHDIGTKLKLLEYILLNRLTIIYID